MSTICKEEGKRVFGKIKKEGLVKGSRFGIQIYNKKERKVEDKG